MIKASLISLMLSLVLVLPDISLASSFAGGTGASYTSPSARLPNIIFIMIDDIGREQYPQLGSPYVHNGVDHFINLTSGFSNKLIWPTASDFPNLNILLANGINFTGMWSGNYCAPSRRMLYLGQRFSTDVAGAYNPEELLTSAPFGGYNWIHYGKKLFNGAGVGGNGPSYSTATSPAGTLSWPDRPTLSDEANLFHSNGINGNESVMFNDELGMLNAMQDIEADYSNEQPKNSSWFVNQTARPFGIAFSSGVSHGGGGIDCVQNRTAGPVDGVNGGHVLPDSYFQANFTNGLPASTPSSPSWGDTPNYSSSSNPSYTAVAATGLPENNKITHDCIVTQLIWVDDTLGRIYDWLGPHGLENTLIILTGDNGTVSWHVPSGDHLQSPLSTTAGAPPTPYYEDALNGYSGGPAPWTTGIGKGNSHETGLNVAFVAGYGPIAKHLRGTSSDARLDFTDVAETIVQLAVPGGDHFPQGEDFTTLLYGTGNNQWSIPGGTGIRVSEISGAGSVETGYALVAAVRDPDTLGGPVYRLSRGDGYCDYIHDLNGVTDHNGVPGDDAFENLRASSDPGVIAALADLQSAVAADHPLILESCVP